jgi:hypothetical protein
VWWWWEVVAKYATNIHIEIAILVSAKEASFGELMIGCTTAIFAGLPKYGS